MNVCFLRQEDYRVRGSSLDWFRLRTQRVQFGNDMSSRRAIRLGVPQGSILRPLLFVLCINDLSQCLENRSINMYADDTVMYFTDLCTSEIARIVQDDLNRVVQWMESSRLILNQSKTNPCSLEVGRILPNHQLFVYSYTERL